MLGYRLLLLYVLLSLSSLYAQDTRNFPTLGEIVRLDARFDKLLPEDAAIEVLSSGFKWSEGPVWVPEATGGYLLFSDIPRNSVMKWIEGQGVSLFLKPSGYSGPGDYGGEPGCNGLALDAKQRLISCEHGDRRLSVLTANGGKMTIADRWQGKRFNSPNDLCIKSNGDIYFTDPIYGLPERQDDPRRELDFCGVYRVRPATGEVVLLTKEFSRPNGIAFSPDESILYVAQSDPESAIIKSFPMKQDGTLGTGKILHDFTGYVGKLKGLPDGLKVDQFGNLFATAPGGVTVLAPDGVALGRIATGEATANCGWGDDGTVLYITADTYLCRVKTSTKGAGW